MRISLDIRFILVILSLVSLIIGGTTLIGLACSLIYGEKGMTDVFLPLTLGFAVTGFIVFRLTRRKIKPQPIKIREGILAVTLCWIFAAVLGSLPYLLAGSHHSFIDAFFESTACITTTGSTLVENLAALPKSLLFWRQLMTWLGGLGIVIFAISVIPMLGYGAVNLAAAEMVSQSVDKIRARLRDSVRNIFLLFVVFTVLEVLFLAAGGLNFYDATILSFSSVGTGGFANFHISGMLGGSLYVDVVVCVFCILASLSFVSYQFLLKRRFRDFFRGTEIRLFFIMLAVVCGLVLIILFVYGTYETAGETFRFGIMQTVSFMTTAGYSGTDVDVWPQATHWLLIAAMIVGGCSGSTSSGIKVARAAVVFALIKRNIYKRLHPNAVVAVKLGDKAVPSDRVSHIATFVILYALILLGSCFVISFEGLDGETTLGMVMAMISNTGLVIGPAIGVSDILAGFSQFSYLYMSLLMFAGRLELLTLVLLFSPAFWKPYR